MVLVTQGLKSSFSLKGQLVTNNTITLTEVKLASYWASCQFNIREIFYVVASFLFSTHLF